VEHGVVARLARRDDDGVDHPVLAGQGAGEPRLEQPARFGDVAGSASKRWSNAVTRGSCAVFGRSADWQSWRNYKPVAGRNATFSKTVRPL